MQDFLKINDNDNVVVALNTIPAGEKITVSVGDGSKTVTAREEIPAGHKMAICDIPEGGEVIKYGYRIGNAKENIAEGSWIHTHNVKTALGDLLEYTYNPTPVEEKKTEDVTFMGFNRPDGKVGVRNEIWVIPTVGCVNNVATAIAKQANAFVKGSVEEVIAFPHPYGCSQMGDDQEHTRKILADLINHPNAGGVLVLGLGCENSNIDVLKPYIGDYDENRVKFLVCQEHEDEIEGTVKLEFQPAEEIFQGSLDMLKNGLLEAPKVDAAVMFHVLAGMPLPAGMVLVPGGGITMASCEQYHIVVHGKGGHGSMPNACIDPITAAAHIHIALQEINSRELDPAGFGVFTTGRFEAGKASNVIPDTADMWGTIRTVDPEQKVSALIHQRMTEIAQGVATAYRCTAEVEFSDYCPCMVVDTPLAGNALTYMTELLGKGAMDMTPLTGGKPGGGSEDFAFVSHEVPTVSMFLAAGNAKEGYTYGQHHPKVRFDDSILYRGTAAYTYMALRWLAEHQ